MDKLKANVLGSASGDTAEHPQPEDESHVAPYRSNDLVRQRIMRPYVNHPAKAMAVGCACHCCMVLIMLIGFMAAGTDFLYSTTGVALHLWHDKWLVATDAVFEGDEVCSYDVSVTQDQPQQTFSRLPIGAGRYELDMVYSAPDGNMLTTDKIQRVKALEDEIVSHADFQKFCLRSASGSCQSPMTVAMACNPTAAQANCDSRKAAPTGLFQCTTVGGCERSAWSINESFLETKVAAYSEATFMVDMPETQFLASCESSFGAGTSTSSAIRSTFKFGFPLEGYTSASDRSKEQQTAVENFMKDAYLDRLLRFNDEQGSNPSFLLGFTGGSLGNNAINMLLQRDMSFIVLAFLGVFIYCSLITKSIWLAVMALAQIFLAFFSGFLVYRIVFASPFFGTFHIMAIFLLLGIGVDDVFVFVDHFAAAPFVDPGYEDDLYARLSWTWKHSTVAMGVTSLTTMVSFLCNAASSFAGIASFGVFAASLIFVMYISMVLFWPAVMAFNYSFFRKKPFLCGVSEKCDKIFRNTSQEARVAVEAEENGLVEKGPKKGLLARFFEDHYSYFILHHRVKVLFVFLVVTVILITQLPNMTTQKTEPQMLPNTHPLYQYGDVMKEKFVRGGGLFNTKVSLVFGFDSFKPIDRTGTDSTGASGRGSINWNPQWLQLENIVRGLNCWIQLCDSAESRDSARRTGGLPAYVMEGCLARDIRNSVNNTARWEQLTGVTDGTVNLTTFQHEVLKLVQANPRVLDKSYAEEVDGRIIYRFFVSTISLTSNQDLDASTGLAIGQAWQDWLEAEMGKGHCVSQAVTFRPFLESDHFAFFQVQETLFKEMIQGICISVGVAFVVLILTTGNIIVGFLAGFTISMILVWVMAMIPIMGWELGLLENIILVMVPGLSVDFTAHLAESYNQAKYADREHRVVHALEHSGVSIIKGAGSTLLAGGVLRLCQIDFFPKFGLMLVFTIVFALLFSLGFFPSMMALIGPCGQTGDWHQYISPKLVPEVERKSLRIDAVPAGRNSQRIQVVPRKEGSKTSG